MKTPNYILPIIVLAQFFCTSLWFAGNSIVGDLANAFQFHNNSVASITSSVQIGFIGGTLVFAVLSIADRFSPSKVFFTSALLAATFNSCLLSAHNTFYSILGFRFLTGFFLAGIYPVGMKIAADYFDTALSKSLGLLVGALVLGTAFPHFLKWNDALLKWQGVLIGTSIIAVLGGTFVLLFVPDGPYRKKGSTIQLSTALSVFKLAAFKKAAIAYFGHMWELYTFWAFVPLMLSYYLQLHPNASINISLWSFISIASGSLGCVLSGLLAQQYGSKTIAKIVLGLSALCCVISPFLFYTNSSIFLSFLIFWGIVVIADSPLLSTLVAQNAPSENKGTALTIVNCLGFAITVVSIQCLTLLQTALPTNYLFCILAAGPIIGFFILLKKA